MTDTSPSPDALSLIASRWRVVAICLALGVAAGVVYSVAAPKWYSATLTVVPSQPPTNMAGAGLAARLPESLDTFSTDVQRIQAVLNSTSVIDDVIDKFNLQNRYATSHREHARAALRQHCVTSADRRTGVVTLTCEDTDPDLAMQIAAYFGDIGNRVFRRISASSAREERNFLEGQLVKARRDVEETSAKLRAFQEKNLIVDLPEQSKAVITAMASLKGEILSKQLELSYLSSFSARTESSVVQLQRQITILEDKLAQLEDAKKSSAPSADTSTKPASEFFPGAMVVPELRFELEKLLREQKIAEAVFSLMTQRFESAKIDEARDTSTFQVLDHPTLPTYHSRPRRRKALTLGVVGGLAVAGAWIFLPIWWRRRTSARP